MARYTGAYSSFVSRIDEVELLRKAAAQKEKENPVVGRHEINALCRGSLVLLCGHLEAYVKELGETALDRLHSESVPRTSISQRIYYHISKDILDEIKGTDDPEKIAGKMFAFLQRDLPLWSQEGPFPSPISSDKFNKGFSTPSFRNIKKYLARFGYSQYEHDLVKHLKESYMPIINMVNHLVDTRNKIAHGDPNATKPPADIKDVVKLVREYCKATDSVFSTWCGSKLCKIK